MANTNYLSTRDAAAKLSIGASTLKKLRIHGGGPSFHRIGWRVVYSTDILDEWATRDTYETTSQDARHLAFVRRARELGFSIDDIRALLKLATPGKQSCAEVQSIASAHLTNVQTKLADLARLEKILAATVGQCGGDASPVCPVLEMLDAPLA